MAKPLAVVKMAEVAEESWAWTPEREKCFDRFLAGWPKKQIADDLKVHRNTVANWCAHPTFRHRLDEHNADHQATTRQRRVRETTMLADKVAKLATSALDSAAKRPDDARSLNTARQWLSEYREFREQERTDSGENVQRHQHAVLGQINHEHNVSRASFKGFLEGALASGVIDVPVLESVDPHDVIIAMTQQALLETDLLDQMGEEDAASRVESAHTLTDRKG